MHATLLDMLVCPACHGPFTWRITAQTGTRIHAADAACSACDQTYPVQEDIGLFLLPDVPRHDLWEAVDSHLLQYLQQHPDVAQQLMETPPAALAPADLFFRAKALDDQRDYTAARRLEEMAQPRLYTAEYLACWQRQTDYLLNQLIGRKGPVVDLASGKGYLVEQIVRHLPNQVVATDFSPSILRRNRRWLQHFGLYDRVSLLAFDARFTPFADASVNTMTTNLGLPNIEESGNLLAELKRIVSGTFLAISFFFPPDDKANRAPIREAGLEPLLYRQSALDAFAAAGWPATAVNPCTSLAKPTPAGEILAGAGIDGLPVAETMLEWAVLTAPGE